VGGEVELLESSPNSGNGQVPQPRFLGREPGLDGLRAVAVLIVFASHVEAFLPLKTLLVVPGGTVGLDPFFVLSGFLITALLLKEQAQYGSIRRWYFYKRRMVRLFPPLFFLLIANVVFAIIVSQWSRQQLESLLSVVFYYSNYYQASSSNLYCSNLSNGYEHLWSLSFEEQFYLFWPWIVIFFLTYKRSIKTVTAVLLGTIAVIGIHRGLGYYGPQSWCYEFHATQDRADALLWGCLAAHLWVRGREPVKLIRILIWPAALLLLACMPFTDLEGPFLYRGGFDLIDLSSAIVLLAILGGTWSGRRIFEWTPLAKLGLIAYAFYLWHVTIFFIMARIDTTWNYELRVVVAFGWTLAMALISWFLLERPLQRWVHRTTPRAPKPSPVENSPPAAGSEQDTAGTAHAESASQGDRRPAPQREPVQARLEPAEGAMAARPSLSEQPSE
jgi:peptidoglycan/LPS O-acetylase OafA/YrhL